MDVSGGADMFRVNASARCGRFHSANTFPTHELAGKAALCIDLGQQPR